MNLHPLCVGTDYAHRNLRNLDILLHSYAMCGSDTQGCFYLLDKTAAEIKNLKILGEKT
jgi:hypothetical protein